MSIQMTAPTSGNEFHAAILDQLMIPIMIVERDASVVYANATAGSVIGDGGPITSISNVLGTISDEEDSQLKKAICDTCVNRAGHTALVGRDRAQPIVTVILPFEGKKASDAGRALVLLRSKASLSSMLVNSLRHLFGLSSAEAAIAVSLSMGASLQEVARSRGVTLNTLRSQLASIMGRTGTRRQAELVALVAQIDGFLQATGRPYPSELADHTAVS